MLIECIDINDPNNSFYLDLSVCPHRDDVLKFDNEEFAILKVIKKLTLNESSSKRLTKRTFFITSTVLIIESRNN